MHVGYNKPQTDYVLGGNILSSITEEKILGVVVIASLLNQWLIQARLTETTSCSETLLLGVCPHFFSVCKPII